MRPWSAATSSQPGQGEPLRWGGSSGSSGLAAGISGLPPVPLPLPPVPPLSAARPSSFDLAEDAPGSSCHPMTSGCRCGGYHLPSDAIHQPSPSGASLSLPLPARAHSVQPLLPIVTSWRFTGTDFTLCRWHNALSVRLASCPRAALARRGISRRHRGRLVVIAVDPIYTTMHGAEGAQLAGMAL